MMACSFCSVQSNRPPWKTDLVHLMCQSNRNMTRNYRKKKKKKSQTFANQVQEKMSFIILRERERKKDYKIDEEIGPVN